MTALLTIWGWLLLGAAIGRVVFVRILGDEPRRGPYDKVDQWGNKRGTGYGWTCAFQRALISAFACVVAWPAALPICLMLAHTGTEKLRAQRERLEAEVAALREEASS